MMNSSQGVLSTLKSKMQCLRHEADKACEEKDAMAHLLEEEKSARHTVSF